MLIEAVFERGQVRFLQPVEFLHDCFSVKIDVPDQEIMSDVPDKHLSDITQSMPAEYLAFKALQAAAFGAQSSSEMEKTDREIMQDHWVSKYV